MRKQRESGIILIITLAVAAILLILALAIWTESNVSKNISQYQQAIALAETGAEVVRGWAQRQTYAGRPLPLTASTPIFARTGGGSLPILPTLYFTSGQLVTFRSRSVSGTVATGLVVTDASGQIIGYYSAIFRRGPPTEVFALGALGNAPNRIYNVKELHTTIIPNSYSQYNYYSGDPEDIVRLSANSRDRITNQPMATACPTCTPSSNCPPYCDPGQTIPMSLNPITSFSKSYMGGKLVASISSSGHQITGFANSQFYVCPTCRDQSLERAVSVDPSTAAVYVPTPNGLYTGPAAASNGLPSRDSLNKIMTALHDVAKGQGLFVWDDTPDAGTGGGGTENSWIPTNAANGTGWDPESPGLLNDDGSVAHGNTLVHVEISSQANRYSCPRSERGNIRISDLARYAKPFYFNGIKDDPRNGGIGIQDGQSRCFDSSQMGNRVMYFAGNIQVETDPVNGYSGQFAIVASGKIDVVGPLVSKSFKDSNQLPPQGVPYQFRASPSDFAAVITPYKIKFDMDRMQGSDLTSTMLLSQIGMPYLGPNNEGNLPLDWLRTPPPSLTNRYNFTILQANDSGGLITCLNAYLFGTQISYHRSSPYGYCTDVYQPYDTNLLYGIPPYSIILNAGYIVAGWAEVNRVSGQDMAYSSP